MKDELAERILHKVMNWPDEEVIRRGQDLQALASLKYDEYGNFWPGQKFLESLASWLQQFEPGSDRATAMEFVSRHLVFVSRVEMDQLISLVYPDVVRPWIRNAVASQLGLEDWQISATLQAPEFAAALRRTLVLGLADGARLDRLRRTSSGLSHEQFSLVVDVPASVLSKMVSKLAQALEEKELPGEPTFESVLLVDDFSGSGYTLIRTNEDTGEVEGKLIKVRDRLNELVENGGLAQNPRVMLVLYVASEQAEAAVRSGLTQVGLEDWEVRVIQKISKLAVEPALEALCKGVYDEALTDKHKGPAILGYRDCRLPLVLSHNTPNNSLSILWGHTVELEGPGEMVGLFPRYERHHPDRP